MKKQSKPITRKTPLKRVGFKKKPFSQLRKFPLGYAPIDWPKKKPLKRIRPRSKKRVKDEKEYSRFRKEFLATHHMCACRNKALPVYGIEEDGKEVVVGMIRCNVRATQVHHKARRGKHFLNVETWLPVCGPCHDWIESNGNEARVMGLLLTPEQRRLLG